MGHAEVIRETDRRGRGLPAQGKWQPKPAVRAALLRDQGVRKGIFEVLIRSRSGFGERPMLAGRKKWFLGLKLFALAQPFLRVLSALGHRPSS